MSSASVVCGPLGREGHGVVPLLVVLGQARVPRDARAERGGELAHAVRAEVEGDDGVARADGRLLPHGRRGDELVRLAALVGRARGVRRHVHVVLALALGEQRDGGARALLALVAVHGVVAADDRADPRVAGRVAPALELLEVARAALRQRVAAVRERVHDDVLDAERRAHRDERLDVALARVHAPVADEADEVHAVRGLEARAQHLVLRERAVLHGCVDAREVLADDGARPEVQVADLRVAHLPLGQPDRRPARRQLRVRVARPEVVEDRGLRERDRVPRPRLGEPPAVEDDEDDAGEGHQAAAATIAANVCGSSEAPPMRPPSTSGSARSSGALSAFMEPP